MNLNHYNVRIKRFDPATGGEGGEEFILPVDSPDEEHAISAAMSNAVAFTRKYQNGQVMPFAFCCTGIERRGS